MDLNFESMIIEKAKQGNPEAWSELFKRNFKPVYNLSLQLAFKDENDAEDIAQQTFIIAAKKINKFNPNKGNFLMWLFGIAKNCHKKHASKKAKYNSNEINATNLESFEKMETDDLNNILTLETLARLPVKHRFVLEAKYLEKKSVNEIAHNQNTTAKAIESRLTRAREKFKLLYLALMKQEYEI